MRLPESDPLADALMSVENHSPIDRYLETIQDLLYAEDFAGIEIQLSRLPELVTGIPDQDRAVELQKVRSLIRAVQSHAVSKSQEIGSRLNALKLGRTATNAYEASEQIPIVE